MKNIYDIVVIGLGIMGSAALWRAAPLCSRVLGIDASGPSHSYGSSQGNSRIFRRAYWEGEKYLPLLNHADRLWNELEHVTHEQLLMRTGGIFIGPESSRMVAGSIETARTGNIEHKVWTSSTLRKTFPVFNVPDGMQAVYEPGAYALSARDARLSMLNEAVRSGAITEFGDTVVSLENHTEGVCVTTQSGRIHFARSVIVTAGPWITTRLMPELSDYLEPRRVPVYWFTPKIASGVLFSMERFPVFLYECEGGGLLYGVPSSVSNGPGVKIGLHNRQQTPTAPDWDSVPVEKRYLSEIVATVGSLFPELEHSPTQAKNCLYTMSKDESFLIGKSNNLHSVYFASACSGHGFKFAPAIGDALARLATGQRPNVPLSAFSVGRFNHARPT